MALLFTLLLGVAMGILGYFMYDLSQQNFIRETGAVIDREITRFTDRSPPDLQRDITELIATRHRQTQNQYYLYTTADDRFLAGNLIALPDDVQRIAEGLIRFDIGSEHVAQQNIDGTRTLAAKIHTYDDGSRLLIARDIQDILSSYGRLQWLSLLIAVLMAAVVGTSFFISVFVVSRLNRMGTTARSIIETGDLSRRLVIDSKWDDLSNLSGILNNLLDRIEELMHDVRQVSDNIAHDLRTPLTRLRNRLDVLAQSGQLGDEGDALVKEADHLLETFSALLRIANVESGKRHQAFESVPLDALLRDVAELYAPLADENSIQLHTDFAPINWRGDRDLLFQACANLLDNAIKFTPEGGTIQLSLTVDDARPIITVADSGDGVPADERERIFQRFYRSETSRNAPGNGLGLSMVAAVVKLHKGHIVLDDNQPGLRIRILL